MHLKDLTQVSIGNIDSSCAICDNLKVYQSQKKYKFDLMNVWPFYSVLCLRNAHASVTELSGMT